MQALKEIFLSNIKYGFAMTSSMLSIVFMGNPDLDQNVKNKRIQDLVETAEYFGAI